MTSFGMTKSGVSHGKIERAILTLWLFVVLLSNYVYFALGTMNVLGLVMAIVIFSVVSVFVSRLFIAGFDVLAKRAQRIPLAHELRDRRYDTALLFVCALAPLLVWWIAFLPGAFSNDSYNQLAQVAPGTYSDWHPVAYTLIAFTLPLALTGGQLWSIVLFQIIEEALVFTYAAATIRMLAPRRFAYMFVLGVVLNPVTAAISVYPWKDIGFGLCATLLVAMTIRLYLDDNWIKHPRNVVALAVTLALCCLMRHNGVLFALPAALILLFINHRRHAVIACTAGLALFMVVRLLVYPAMNVEKPDRRGVEVLGLPLSILANVMSANPDSLDSDIREFLLEVSPEENWINHNVTAGYNDVKYKKGTDLDVIEQAGVAKVLDYTIRASLASPGSAYQAVYVLLQMPHALGGVNNTYIQPRELDESKGITTYGPQVLRKALTGLLASSHGGPLDSLIWHMGFLELLAIAAMCAYVRRTKIALFVLPLMSYNLVTSLLLTGKDYRFFWLTIPVGLLLLLALPFFAEKNGDEEASAPGPVVKADTTGHGKHLCDPQGARELR